jgi:polysaccharide pyruvyl transferase WcaK-like protein
MKIGIVGYYGYQNAGDERILFCLKRFFSQHEIVVVNGFEEAVGKLESLNRCDYVLFGGGGLILRGLNYFVPWLEGIHTRFGCIGISVETLNRDNKDFVDLLKQKSEFILVRDKRSLELLGHHYKVIVGPDLTFLYPYEIIAPVKDDVCGINLRPWHYWKSDYRDRYYYRMVRLNQRFPGLKKYYPLPKWEPGKAVALAQTQFGRLIPIPLQTGSDINSDESLLTEFFGELPAQTFLASLKQCRYLVGMRLHALMFACQMGIPFVSLSYQPKNEAFCNAIGLETVSFGLYTRVSKFEEALLQMKASYHDTREILLDYRSQSSKVLNDIMGSISRLLSKSWVVT